MKFYNAHACMMSSLGVNKRPAGMWVLAALPKNSFVFVMYVEVMQGWKGTHRTSQNTE